MMDFAPFRPRRRSGENIVPMINVVFLLLIFFLMTAQIAPPEPFDVSVPLSDAEAAAERSDRLFISSDGVLFYNGVEGKAALNAIAARSQNEPLFIEADAMLSAATLAALLPKLAAAGVRETRLVTGVR